MSDSIGADRYLDLLKKTLTYSLWPEPGIPIDDLKQRRKGRLRLAHRALQSLSHFINRYGFEIVKQQQIDPKNRAAGYLWPMHAETMVGMARLDNLQHCVEQVLADNIPGDLIETGVWRGGSCILMRGILAAHGVTDRRVFVADSFEGLPEPNAEAYPADAGDTLYQFGFLAVSQEAVAENFRKYDLLDDQVVFLKGWFKDTLPTAPIQQIAVMRLDGDLYESTMDALKALYPKLSVGGYCIIDDYALPATAKAVQDYRAEHDITAPIQKIDWTGAYWRNESSDRPS